MRAIIAALLANLGIAITKFIAWAFSGASSMLAEAVHSLADSGNQLLLIAGSKRAKKAATTEHPFGYGRSRYVFAFIVSVVLFTVGGVFSIYEGIEKLSHPHELENVWLPILVLAIAIVMESFSLRTAVIESNHVRGGKSWVEFVKRAKSPELPVVLLEDVAALLGLVFALIGIGMAVITGNPVWDALGTLAIGALLIVVAVVLGLEMSSLLVGEGAGAEDVAKIAAAIRQTEGVTELIHMKTLYVGPEELLVAAKIGIAEGATGQQIAEIIDSAELQIRNEVAVAKVIYLEPAILIPRS